MNRGLLRNLPAWISETTDVAIVRALDDEAETIYGMAPDEVIEVLKGASDGTGSLKVSFAAPRNENLLLEYAEAANKIVTATAVNLTLDEALDLIAEESGCNIFQDDETIVVDYCD